MADYYPLLSRAVAGLVGQPASARDAIYARARVALERQLRGFEPALGEDAVQTELSALEATIARIEAEHAVAQAEPETAMPELPPVETPAPAVDTPAETLQGATTSAVPDEKTEADLPVTAAADETNAGEVTTKEASTSDTPVTTPIEPNPDAAPSVPDLKAEQSEEAAQTPLPRPPLLAIRPTVNDLPPKEEMGIPLKPPAQLSDLPEKPDFPRLPEQDETDLAPLPPEPEASIPTTLRPRMPSSRSEDKTPGSKPLTIFAGIAIISMMIMGAVALARRGTPERAATPPIIAAPEAPTDSSKTEGRLSSMENPGKPIEARETALAPQPKTDEAKPAPATATEAKPANPATPVIATNRAFMVLEVQGSAPNQFEGKTVWSFAPDPSLKGQRSLRAAITFPQAQMSIDFSIARNTDAAINASHTVMVVFETLIENVKEMSAVEWRERENQAGTLLAGIVVPIQENVFMIGLDKSEVALTRNLDLMRSQKWMVFEFRMVNGRRGAILVEKGVSGEQAISDALASWK